MRRLVALLLLLTAGCGPGEIDARPALWRVSDSDTEIWLLGTIHALPPGVRWETPAVAEAIARADTLVTEIPAGDADVMAKAFVLAATAPGLPAIADRVPPDRRSELEAAADEAGVSPATLGGMRTWAVAVTIAGASERALHATAEHGLEAALAERFAGRRHLALETQAGQLAAFNALPEAAQRVLLVRAITDRHGFGDTLAAWEKGDVPALAASLEPAFRGAPELRRALVTARNARWTDWIARRMARPGRVLVAVGAGHLAGADSVLAMLSARGLKVARVQ